MRAALEGVCQQLALVLASMRDAGNEVREIRATGGFARSALWRQMLADALGMPIGFPAGHEGSGFGAALLGMEALGLVDGIDRAAELVGIDEVVEPDAGRGGGLRRPAADLRGALRRAGCRPSARCSATAEAHALGGPGACGPRRGVLSAGAAIDAWPAGAGPAEGRRERACALVMTPCGTRSFPRPRRSPTVAGPLARYQPT